jgi:hypothetical protein
LIRQTPKHPSGRKLKQQILKYLQQEDFVARLDRFARLPSRKAVNPLFAFLHHNDAIVKWHTVTAMGEVVSTLALSDMESSRVVMRRLLWNLNDESGGIGWGSAEAMGEIMARHAGLAAEYANLLVSFVRQDGNYIEYEALQSGVIWGLGRLAQKRPRLLTDLPALLPPYLRSDNAAVRGTAAWAAGFLDTAETKGLLNMLVDDNTPLQLYLNCSLIKMTVGRMAREALT